MSKAESIGENGAAAAAQAREAAGSIKRRLFLTFGAQSAVLGFRVVLQLVTVPLLIHFWGAALYADWLVLNSATGLLAMLDFGLMIYYGNAILIAWSQGDRVQVRRQLSVAMAFYAAIVGTAIVLLALSPIVVPWMRLFKTSALSHSTTLATAGLLAAATLFAIPTGVITSLYRAHGDYARNTLAAWAVEVSRAAGVCAVVALGGSPLAAAGVSFAVVVIYWLGLLVDQTRLYGGIPLTLRRPRPKELREGCAGASLYMIVTVVGQLTVNGPVVLLGALGAPSLAIVAFSVARTFTGVIRQFVYQFCHPVGAELTRQQAIGDRPRLRRLYYGAGRFVSAMSGLIAGYTVVIALPFIPLWTRGAVPDDPWLVAAFAAAIVLMSPSQVANFMFLYNNRPGILVVAWIGDGLALLVFCVALIPHYAAAGAAVGVGLAEFLSLGLAVAYAGSKEISVRLSAYLGRCYAFAAAGLLLGYAVARALLATIPVHGFAGIAALSAAWAVLLAGPSLLLLAGPTERAWLAGAVFARLRPQGGAERGPRVSPDG